MKERCTINTSIRKQNIVHGGPKHTINSLIKEENY